MVCSCLFAAPSAPASSCSAGAPAAWPTASQPAAAAAAGTAGTLSVFAVPAGAGTDLGPSGSTARLSHTDAAALRLQR